MRRNSMLAQVVYNCCVNGLGSHLIKLYNEVEKNMIHTVKNKCVSFTKDSEMKIWVNRCKRT